jgi:hypothetical protein
MTGNDPYNSTTSLSTKAIGRLIEATLGAAGLKTVDIQVNQGDIHIWLPTAADVSRAQEVMDIGFLIDAGLADHRPVYHTSA